MTQRPPIRVLVVDDSAFMRKMVGEMLAHDPRLRVVGTARDGAEALSKRDSLQPDVVTLDVEMPVLDGFGTLAALMERGPIPVIMLSSRTQTGADATLRCLELGAVDFVGKPSGAISLDIATVAAELAAKIKAAAGAQVMPCQSVGAAPRGRPAYPGRPALSREGAAGETGGTREKGSHGGAPLQAEGGWAGRPAVLLIGCSTGGPRALQTLIPALPADLPIPIVLVQHMPPGFTASLAQRLEEASPFRVREAVEGDPLQPGVILVAPGGRHLRFDADGAARLTEEPPVHGVRPSIDVTLASLAALHGSGVIAALLTGMGRDGARGLKLISDLGGRTLAEDHTTCVVYGMPRAAVELGGVGCLLPLPQIAPALARLCAASCPKGEDTR